MKHLFDKISAGSSKLTTRTYSTSFSLGIHCLNKSIHAPIYAIYGFVRLADEIVDSFHDYDKAELLSEFKHETFEAIRRKISLNPILNSFQRVVHDYHIELELIECFLESMEMDLSRNKHSTQSYGQYILGSAEVVGLMCLRVFTNGDNDVYQELKPAAMNLGAAFQKINFLRDLNEDYTVLGRVYFPNIDMSEFSGSAKAEIEREIEMDFAKALEGIKKLPKSSRFGVYVAYVYYYSLFKKIKGIPSRMILAKRVRISNYRKIGLLARSYFRHSLRML